MTTLKLLGATLVGCTLLAACASTPDPGPSAASCKLPRVIDRPASVPSDVPVPDVIELTGSKVRKKFVVVDGHAKTSVKDLFDVSAKAITEGDFEIINTDYEGFEAELYFARGTSIAGIVRLREGPCDGYVSMNLLYDPLDTERGKKAIRKTRDLTRN